MTAAAVPGIAEQLEAVYGTGYAGFATLDQVDKIMAERTRHFVGRDDQLAALDAFVASNPCGIMVIAAPGAFGKSALLANWGPRQAARGAAVAYHFFSATAARTTEPTDALKGLLMQLAFLGKRPAPMLPNDPYKLHKMLNEELCRDARRDRPLIVILDGLDESLDESFSLIELSEELGQHVYIFASGEPVQNVYIFVPQLIVPAARALQPKYLTEWLRVADRRDYPVLCHDIPQLSAEGVLAWVRGLVPRPTADQEARLAKCLAAMSEGVPLFLQLIVDDIRDRRARGESFAAIIGSLEALPDSFTEYAAQQLLAMGEMQRQTPGAFAVDVARVFALLTLAKGGLPLDDLRQVLQTSANPQAFDPRMTRWFARCSVGDEPAIAFRHPRLADVFRSRLAADTLAEVEDRLVAHCASAWSKGSLYALTNLPLHQLEAGQVADAIATLTDLAFLDARFGHEAAPALIERTAQDFEAADDAAPSELRTETSLHRCFWGDVYRRLLELARGPQHHRTPEVLRQLLRDNPLMAERYATGDPAWLQVAGRITPTWWRINGQLPTPPQERIGHSMWVRGAAALSDGRLLSWSDDTTLRLWASDGAPLAEPRGHRGRVFGATVLSDGRLLSWSEDGTLRLWTSDGTALAELKGHGDGSWVHGATELRDGRLLSWSDEPTLRLWTSDGAPLAELKGHSGPIWDAAVLSDGRLLSCSGDETLRLWASDGAPLAELIGHDDTAYGATELSDGRLLSWTVGATLRLWASDGAALAELKGHSGRVWGVAELKDGRRLSWSDDTTLRLWARDGAPLAELKGHNNRILGAKVLSDGRLLSWSVDGTLRLWSSDGAALAELKGHTQVVMGAIELGDGRLLSWSDDGTLRLWASDGAFQSLWLWPHGDINSVIPHTDRPGVFWVLANVHVLQVRHQPAGATEQILRFGAP